MEEQTNEGKAEKVFQNFGKRVDQFLKELDEAGTKLNKEFEGKYEELKEAAEKLRKDTKDKDRWKEVEESLKKAGRELENAFKAAFKKKQENN